MDEDCAPSGWTFHDEYVVRSEIAISEINIFTIWQAIDLIHDSSHVGFSFIMQISYTLHVIIIIINKQGQMISRMRVLIIQAK